MLDAAHAGRAAEGLGDDAFRHVMLLAALVSMPALWFVTWLPDQRLNDTALDTPGAAEI